MRKHLLPALSVSLAFCASAGVAPPSPSYPPIDSARPPHHRRLLMTEPLASLDIPRKTEILDYVERLRDELHIPIIYVSHSVPEITRLVDTVVLLSDGKCLAVGDVDEVMGRVDLRPATGDHSVLGRAGRYSSGQRNAIRIGQRHFHARYLQSDPYGKGYAEWHGMGQYLRSF